MPKIKTNKAAAKRFTRTGSGKWKRRKAFGRHLLTVKNRKRKRHYKGTEILSRTDLDRVRQLLPNHG